MIRRLCLLSFLALILLAPAAATAQESSSAATRKRSLPVIEVDESEEITVAVRERGG